MAHQDSTKTILSSAKHFFSGTMLSRLSGLARDVTMAAAFGTAPAVAALFVAYRFSHMFRRLLGEGALQSAFIPQFELLRKDAPAKAKQFFKDLYVSLTVSLIFLVLLSLSALLGIITYIPLSEGNLQILKLAATLTPGLLFICLNGLNTSLLQCEKSYFIPSVAPVFFNCVWIIGSMSLFNIDAAQAMPWLAGFIVFSCFAQWLFTTPKTVKTLNLISKSPAKIKLFPKSLKYILKPLALGIIGIAASQINNVLDVLFARYAHPEGPAFLWYAARIQQLPIGLFGVAISGALLPPLARTFKQEKFDEFIKFLNYGLSRLLLIMIPVTFAYIVGADTGINLLLGRGHFDNESIVNTTWCLWGYTLGIIPLSFVLILAPAFYAQNDYRTPTVASLTSVAINTGLNAFFVIGLKLGPASVALATSISTLINCAVLLAKLNKGYLSRDTLLSLSVNMLFSSVAGAILVLFVDSQFLNGNNTFRLIIDLSPELQGSFLDKLTFMGVETLAFVLGTSVCFLGIKKSCLMSQTSKNEYKKSNYL